MIVSNNIKDFLIFVSISFIGILSIILFTDQFIDWFLLMIGTVIGLWFLTFIVFLIKCHRKWYGQIVPINPIPILLPIETNIDKIIIILPPMA